MICINCKTHTSHLVAIFLVNFLTGLPEHGTNKSRSSYQILWIHYASRGWAGVQEEDTR